MKKISMLISLGLIAGCIFSQKADAQRHDVLNYNLNGFPVNGIKIKTRIPFQNSSAMPTVRIEGYFYGEQEPIGLDIVWYVYDNSFIKTKVSSWGATTPPVYLSNEDGFISIFIDDKPYYPRFNVEVYAKGLVAETDSAFLGWTAADEPLGGTNQTLVPYTNRFAGTVTVGANYHDNGTDIFQVATGSGGQYFRVLSGGIGITDASWLNTLMFSNNNTYDEIQNNVGKPLVLQYTNGGNVLIGKTTQTDTSYKLDVNGNIRANKVVVNTTGADYVFDPTYKMPSLDSLSRFIQQYRHLPGVHPARQMQADGIDVGENQAKLLQKIEELTLYIIEQNREQQNILQELKAIKAENIILKQLIKNEK